MWQTDDLGSGLLQMGMWVGGFAAVAWVTTWWTRRRGRDTLALSVTRSVAGMTIGLALVGLVFGSVNQFVAQPTWLNSGMRMWVDDHLAMLASPACDVNGSFAPGSPGDEGALSYCKGSINYLPFEPRLVLFIASVFTFVATVAVAWSIYTAALLASRREPFHRSVYRTFSLAGIVAFVAVAATETLTPIGMTMAARTLAWTDGVQPPFLWSLSLMPFGLMIGLFALAAVFRYGYRLERDAEGLV